MKKHRCLFIIFLSFLQIVAAMGAEAGGDFYYSIHGASYREQEQARSHIASVENMGYPAFFDKVEIPGKGLWHRVYIGKYDNREAAKKAANVLRKKNVIDYIRINRFMSSDTAARSAMGKKGKLEIKRVTALPGAQLSPSAAERKSAIEAKKKEKQEEKRTPKFKDQQVTLPNGAWENRAQNTDKRERPSEKQAPISKEQQTTFPVEDQKVVKGEQVDSPLNGALNAYKAERYEEAIELLKGLLKSGNLDKATHERGLRLMADCHYSLGARGDRQQLLMAVDQYKNILHRYPDPAGENDRLYFNLAVSYEKLNFFYEASGTWEKLILAHPGSPFLQEAMFRVGDVLRPTAKYSRAADKLLAYLKKFPDGFFAKKAYFILGDCYYRMQNNNLAGRWFDEARKKWSDLHDVHQTILLNMGNNYHIAGRFDEAFQVYSLCTTLYSPSVFGKDTLFRAARAADEAGHAALAVRLYGSIMATYPGDALGDECSLALATLGIFRPGMRVPIDDVNMNDYREPLKTYGRILAKHTSGDLTERTMLSLSRALEKKGAAREAVANCLDMLNRFPRSKYSEEALGFLKSQALSLLNAYHAKGDHLAVSDLYFKVQGKVSLKDDYESAFRTGISLQTIGLLEEAGGLFASLKEIHKTNRERNNALTAALAQMEMMAKKQSETGEKGRKNYLKAYKDYQQNPDKYDKEQIAGLFIGLGDLYCGENNFRDGIAMYRQALPYLIDINDKRWLLLKIGQGYAHLDDFDEAEKNLAQIKEGEAEEFWIKIADLYITDNRRMEKSEVRR